MKTLPLVSFIIFVSSCAFWRSNIDGKVVSLRIEIEKNEYLMGEHVVISWEIKNLINKEISVYYPLISTEDVFRFSVWNAVGRLYEYNPPVRVAHHGHSYTVPLKARDSSYHLNSLEWYADAEGKWPYIWHFFRPGNYSVQAVYFPFGGRSDSVVSNILYFRVSYPNEIDESAFKIIRKARVWFSNYIGGQGAPLDSLNWFWKYHQGSAYIPNILSLLYAVYNHSKDTVRARSIADTLMNQYANSLITQLVVESEGGRLSADRRIEFYQQIENQYNETRLEKFAKYRKRLFELK